MKNLFAIFLTISLTFSVSSYAKFDAAAKKELIDRQSGLTSKGVQRRLMRANELIVQNNRAGAIKILESMSKKSYRPFELGKIWQALAYAYAQSEQYPKAKHAFQKALDQNALPYRPTLQSIFSLAQLHLMDENYEQAQKQLSNWFSLTKIKKADAYVFLATIQFHKKENKLALESILTALSLTKSPKENWLTFAVSLLYEEGRYTEAGKILFKLVEMNHSKKMYWNQLVGTLLNNNKSLEALAVLDLALKMKLLDQEGEFLNIISLYLSNGLPYEASILLKTAMSKSIIKKNYTNLKLYADCLIQAKEYQEAMAPLAEAANLSKDGKLFALKARLFLEKESFKNAIKYFDLALAKGLPKKTKGQVLVEKSIALIELGLFSKATPILEKALKYKESAQIAQNWKTYIETL